MVGFQETDATIVKRDMRYSVVNLPFQRPKVPVFPEVRLSTSQMVRLEGGGCRASQLNERNGGKGYDSEKSLFGWTE